MAAASAGGERSVLDRREQADGKDDVFTDTPAKEQEEGDPCVRVLEGHSKAVTALYYEEGCLVSVVNL